MHVQSCNFDNVFSAELLVDTQIKYRKLSRVCVSVQLKIQFPFSVD